MLFHSKVHLLFYCVASQYYEMFLQHVLAFFFTVMSRQLSLDVCHLGISFLDHL